MSAVKYMDGYFNVFWQPELLDGSRLYVSDGLSKSAVKPLAGLSQHQSVKEESPGFSRGEKSIV